MTTLFVLATFLYFLGMVKYLLHLGLRNKLLFILANVMIFLGFILETAAFIQRSSVTGHGPYTNVFEYYAFSAWVVFGSFMIAEGYFKIKPLGAFMTPLGFLLMTLAFVFSSDTQSTLPVKAYWLTMHRTLSFLGFGALTFVFAAGVMYLIQHRQLKHKKFGLWYHRLPSLDILDDANRVGLIFGFPIITVGALAAMAWTNQKYGMVIKFSASTVALLVAWMVYAVLVFGRSVLGWRGGRAAILGIIGFGVVALSLLIHLS